MTDRSIDPNNICIFQGDCRVLLKSLPDESVDCVATDPPYKITSRGTQGTMGGFWADARTRKGNIFDVNDITIAEYLPELYRVLKNGTHCYIMCNNKNLTHFLTVIDASPFHFVKCLIWDKQSKICGTYYMGQYEYIIMLRKGSHRAINDCATSDLLSYPVPKNKARDRFGNLLNPTQKPEALFWQLFRNSTNEGDVVLDPFMGCGTAAFVAASLGRKFIGVEIDPRQVEYVRKRLAGVAAQQKLFEYDERQEAAERE